ncbi:hypothetical protein ACFEMC_14165 [Kineococcus sp. DHX-1]|uniref:hypothetical protein n=1 Tax=Kineococcus sp. DHX-1 TaxID=3349638 RepID=UPI0036D36F5D
MTGRPRWRATNRRQSKTFALLWGVLAIVWWLLLASGGNAWWQYVTGAAWTAMAIGHGISWRLWRPEWDSSGSWTSGRNR